MIKKRVFGEIRKVSLVDYPSKISAVVYLHGCNMMCSYCHNSSLIEEDGGYNIDEIVAQLKTIIEKDIIDGVVISGGEPSLHHDLVLSLIDSIRVIKDIPIKVDTNGSSYFFVHEILKKNIDHIAIDFKTISYEKMFKDIKSETIWNSIILATAHENHEIRITLAPEYMNKKSVLMALDILHEMNVKNISLQKYHSKNALLPLKDTEYTTEDLHKIKEIADAMGFNTKLRM